MPRIDTKSIEGYDSMTPEEKLSALESIEIPADQTEEIIKLKRGLSLAHMEIAHAKEAAERDGKEYDSLMDKQSPAIQAHVNSLSETIQIGREALDLEACGFSYSEALMLAEATHAGDFDKAAKIMEAHENNERTTHAAEIKEAEKTARLRKAFGLR